MTTNKNLELWGLVETTDPRHTTKIIGKPYRGTSPRPYYLVRRATEIFGPCGSGWGFEVLSQTVVDGAPGDKLHIAHVRVWYMWHETHCTVEHVGQTMLCGKNKNGPFTDEDAPKKSVTDALVKAMSMIGFAGDIFMGRFDDSKYVESLMASPGAVAGALVTQEQAEYLLTRAGPNSARLAKVFGVTSLLDLPAARYEEAVGRLDQALAVAAGRRAHNDTDTQGAEG